MIICRVGVLKLRGIWEINTNEFSSFLSHFSYNFSHERQQTQRETKIIVFFSIFVSAEGGKKCRVCKTQNLLMFSLSFWFHFFSAFQIFLRVFIYLWMTYEEIAATFFSVFFSRHTQLQLTTLKKTRKEVNKIFHCHS